MATHTIEGVTPAKLEAGLAKLKNSGLKVDGNKVTGMGVEATYALNGETLTVDVEKAPMFFEGMIEQQLRQFFS